MPPARGIGSVEVGVLFALRGRRPLPGRTILGCYYRLCPGGPVPARRALADVSTPQTGGGPGMWAVGISLFAALVQQLRVALHPVYFNHNALYHVLRAAALFLGFPGQPETG